MSRQIELFQILLVYYILFRCFPLNFKTCQECHATHPIVLFKVHARDIAITDKMELSFARLLNWNEWTKGLNDGDSSRPKVKILSRSWAINQLKDQPDDLHQSQRPLFHMWSTQLKYEQQYSTYGMDDVCIRLQPLETSESSWQLCIWRPRASTVFANKMLLDKYQGKQFCIKQIAKRETYPEMTMAAFFRYKWTVAKLD